jgi:hypothetical protein
MLDVLGRLARLSDEPQVIHVPKVKDRYFVIPLMDPSTEDFENLGSVHRTPPGDYAVVGPDNDVKLPKHLPRIESYAKGEDLKDLKQVHKIQDGITVSR